jgi:ribosome-associated translation inhibitor RaiA
MKTNIRFTGMEPSERLQSYVDEKVEAFSKLLDPETTDAAICDVELTRDTKHQTGDVCSAEFTLEADGKVYRVCKSEPTFEKAIDKVKDDILQSLRVEKQKHIHSLRKGASAIKKMLQGDAV